MTAEIVAAAGAPARASPWEWAGVNAATFLASEHAAAMTGAVANVTCGMSVD